VKESKSDVVLVTQEEASQPSDRSEYPHFELYPAPKKEHTEDATAASDNEAFQSSAVSKDQPASMPATQSLCPDPVGFLHSKLYTALKKVNRPFFELYSLVTDVPTPDLVPGLHFSNLGAASLCEVLSVVNAAPDSPPPSYPTLDQFGYHIYLPSSRPTDIHSGAEVEAADDAQCAGKQTLRSAPSAASLRRKAHKLIVVKCAKVARCCHTLLRKVTSTLDRVGR